MKYISNNFASSFLIFSSLFFSKDGISNIYAGLDLGYNKIDAILDSKTDLTGDGNGSLTSKLNPSNLSAGILAGLGKDFENYFIAMEGFASHDSEQLNKGNVKDQTFKNNALQINIIGIFRFKLQMKHTFGLGFIAGVKTNTGLKPFIRLDVLNSKFSLAAANLSEDGSPVMIIRKNKNLWGVSSGAGVDYDFTPKFSGRIVYKLNIYQKYKSRLLPFEGDEFTNSSTFRPMVHNVRVGLIYKITGSK
jgi:opacity protein-like surface antigen